MKTFWKINGLALAAALGAGCGGPPSAELGSHEGALAALPALADLPACAAVARPTGDLAVEELAGTRTLIVRAGTTLGAPVLCQGSSDEVGDLFVRQRVAPGTLVTPIRRATSDPMPADGTRPTESDPMPAGGTKPAESDPMPADEPRGSDPMPAKKKG